MKLVMENVVVYFIIIALPACDVWRKTPREWNNKCNRSRYILKISKIEIYAKVFYDTGLLYPMIEC